MVQEEEKLVGVLLSLLWYSICFFYRLHNYGPDVPFTDHEGEHSAPPGANHYHELFEHGDQSGEGGDAAHGGEEHEAGFGDHHIEGKWVKCMYGSWLRSIKFYWWIAGLVVYAFWVFVWELRLSGRDYILKYLRRVLNHNAN